MATTSTRQFNLFVTEDWKKVYETFREADFQSYDYETIRKSMIDYLRVYYPEDFNDFIESSEYIALIDMIAFLGQSLAFRTDMNARENFLETAERRDSVLKLARMLSYFPKRNQVARGMLKVESVSTTENIIDSNGFNLADTTIIWDDSTNTDFLEQFTLILNTAMRSSQRFGKPSYKDTINGIITEEYEMNIIPETIPVYGFNSIVNGVSMDFEIVSGTFSGQSFIYENPPIPSNALNIIYRSDGKGNSSVNTGFFFYFKQGSLQQSDFNIRESISNRIVNVNVNNVDNNDVWLYDVDSSGRVASKWTKVPAITGANVIYNDLALNTRTLYAVNGREGDQIDLAFGDGVFSDIPVGDFRVIFRTGNGLSYKVSPEDLQNVSIEIPYISRSGQVETLTVEMSLQQTVSNASARESITDVKTKAPQQYYTQNRMINGEDYNIFPLTKFNDILKVKSINRTSSGISRYLDVRDTTGKYSSTNIFADDGVFYRHEDVETFTFEFINDNDILDVILNRVEPILRDKSSLHFFYENYPQTDVENLNIDWKQETTGTNLTTGFFRSPNKSPQAIGDFVSSDLKSIKTDALVKFFPPTGFHFTSEGELAQGEAGDPGTSEFIWAAITNVIDDGSNQGNGALESGLGPVSLNEIVPTSSIPKKVYVPFVTNLTSSTESEIITRIKLFKEFGLRYDQNAQEWKIIEASNLDRASTFSLDDSGDTSGTQQDNSWFIMFETDGETYTVSYRVLDYFFESELQTRFYFEPSQKIFDSRTGQTIKDNIKVLKVNAAPDSNEALGTAYDLAIHDNVQESDGYVDSTKIKITFSDKDDDNIPDNPEVFDIVVAPDTNPIDKLVFFQRVVDANNFERWKPIDTTTVNTSFTTEDQININLDNFSDGQIFYATTEEKFYELSVDNNVRTIAETTDYRKRTGRMDMDFQYTHNSPNNRRIDPSPANFVDMFILTRQYDTDYRSYVFDSTNTIAEPEPPTTFELRNSFGSLDAFKAMSDTIIFNSAIFKPLFGSKAEPELQADFKIVKSDLTLITDSEIKVRAIDAINEYFSVDNWDFGDTFHFSELAAFIHKQLIPDIVNVVIVPKSGDQSFGSLFQITSQRHEIFISAATVNDVSIIDAITSARLRASGNVITSSSQDTIVSGFNTSVQSTNLGDS